MIVQLWEDSKNHGTVYFKGMNFMTCELYDNKAVILKILSFKDKQINKTIPIGLRILNELS